MRSNEESLFTRVEFFIFRLTLALLLLIGCAATLWFSASHLPPLRAYFSETTDDPPTGHGPDCICARSCSCPKKPASVKRKGAVHGPRGKPGG